MCRMGCGAARQGRGAVWGRAAWAGGLGEGLEATVGASDLGCPGGQRCAESWLLRGGGAVAANCCLLPEMPALGGLIWGLFIAGRRLWHGPAPGQGVLPRRGGACVSSAEGPRCPLGSVLAVLESGHEWGGENKVPGCIVPPPESRTHVFSPLPPPSRVPCGSCCNHCRHVASEPAGIWPVLGWHGACHDFCVPRPVSCAVPQAERDPHSSCASVVIPWVTLTLGDGH